MSSLYNPLGISETNSALFPLPTFRILPFFSLRRKETLWGLFGHCHLGSEDSHLHSPLSCPVQSEVFSQPGGWDLTQVRRSSERPVERSFLRDFFFFF